MPVSPLPSSLRSSALLVLGLTFAAAIVFYRVVSSYLSIGSGVVAFATCLLAAIFALVFCALPYHHHSVFGAANAVTAIRTAIVCLVAAIVVFAADLFTVESASLVLIGLVAAALVLDGVDGYLARSFGTESAFGARFDMEVDALLILVLSLAGMLLGKADWWILAIGSMRYGFVAAQHVMPALTAPLPHSFRRKLICVIQVLVLCLILMPAIVPPISTLAAFVALTLLIYSFCIDTVYLLCKEVDER